MDNNIWFSDINIILNKDKLFEIIPTSDMSNGAKINSISRFAFYLSILLFLVSGNYLYFYIFLGTTVTYIIYVFNVKIFNEDSNDVAGSDSDSDNINSITENKDDCKNPTKENPLMNPLLGENPYKNKKLYYIK